MTEKGQVVATEDEMKCLACKRTDVNGELLTCCLCEAVYHYLCLNITSAQFMAKRYEFLRSWTCPDCFKLPSRGPESDGTPVRSQQDMRIPSALDTTADPNMSVDDMILNDNNVQGDTINSNKSIIINPDIKLRTQSFEQPMITLDQISKLLDSKLQQINNDIVEKLNCSFHSAINNLKVEMLEHKNKLKKELNQLQEEVVTIYNTIQLLEAENKKLHQEIEELTNRIYDTNTHGQDINTTRRIVLYGFRENSIESEQSLIQLVCGFFYDAMGVDLNPFIENVKRLGKRGKKRPIQIELLSQRITNYLLTNSYHLRNTGFYISQYLNKSDFEQRKMCRQVIWDARREGKHAVVRGNKIFINGKEHLPSLNNDENHNTMSTQQVSQDSHHETFRRG